MSADYNGDRLTYGACCEVREWPRSSRDLRTAGGLQYYLADDNCFFGSPAVIDRVLDQLHLNYSATYVRCLTIPNGLASGRPERMLTTAGFMAGVHRTHPCTARTVQRVGRIRPLGGASPVV